MNLINPTLYSGGGKTPLTLPPGNGDSNTYAGSAHQATRAPFPAMISPTDIRALTDHAQMSAEFFENYGQAHTAEIITRIFQSGVVPPRSLGWAVARSLTAMTWRWIESAYPGCNAEASLFQALSQLAPESFAHSNRVCDLSGQFARELGASESEQDQLRQTATFKECGVLALQLASLSEEDREEAAHLLRSAGHYHDIGKLAMSSDILNKPAALTEEERALMALHPLIGEAMLENVPSARPILPAVRHHHEHWDGRGYVDGLAGERIPELGRIISITDAFDAMTEGRPYRAARTSQEACAELLARAGTQFDPVLVERFVGMVLS